MGEKLAFHWHKLYKIPVNSIRIFNAYGPRVRTTGVYGAVFGVFFKQKLAKKPLLLSVTVVKKEILFMSQSGQCFLNGSYIKN